MTRSQFFQHFDLLADQPDAVAKMRELVFELAAEGKLFHENGEAITPNSEVERWITRGSLPDFQT